MQMKHMIGMTTQLDHLGILKRLFFFLPKKFCADNALSLVSCNLFEVLGFLFEAGDHLPVAWSKGVDDTAHSPE